MNNNNQTATHYYHSEEKNPFAHSKPTNNSDLHFIFNQIMPLNSGLQEFSLAKNRHMFEECARRIMHFTGNCEKPF
jgi:hypothetical protein